MSEASYFWLAAAGLLLMTLASLGAKVLHEIAWHELKEFCKRRQRRELFDEIHDGHDDVTLGLETLYCVASIILLAGVVGWFATAQQASPIRLPAILRVTVPLLLLVLAGSVWLPSAVARLWGSVILFQGWRVFRVASHCVYPLVLGAYALEAAVRRMGDQSDEPSEEEAFEDEILAIVTEGMHDGHLEADAREMIEGVIELGDADVADIMTPRSKMDALSADLDWDDVLRFVTTCGRTRIPVYRDNLDRIIGILYVKDLLAEFAHQAGRPRTPLSDLLRKPWYVPTSQKLDDLLQDFRQTRNHLAIVRDEFSRVAGLVTIEDVLEEIVGEIVDETDKELVQEIHRVDDHTAVIQGRAHLAEVNQQLGLDLPEPEDFDTIAGYVVHHLGRIPTAGERIENNAVRITVLQASKRRVEQVKLEMLEWIAD